LNFIKSSFVTLSFTIIILNYLKTLLAFAQRGKRNCIFATHTLAKVSCKVPFTSKSAFVEKTVERLTAISMPVVLLACFTGANIQT
jgi:hypothetical protein